MTKILSYIIFAVFIIAFSTQLKAAAPNVLDGYGITALASNFQTITLSDGSVWSINSSNAPNLKGATWSVGPYPFIWIRPFTQNSTFGVILVNNYFGDCAQATLKTPGQNVKIGSIDTTNNLITLVGYAKWPTWSVKSFYYNSYSTWQVGDYITVAGNVDGYFLINTTRQLYVGVTP